MSEKKITIANYLQLAKDFKKSFGMRAIPTRKSDKTFLIDVNKLGDVELLRTLAQSHKDYIREMESFYINANISQFVNDINANLGINIQGNLSFRVFMDMPNILNQAIDMIDNVELYTQQHINDRLEKIEQCQFAILDKINILAQYLDEALARTKPVDLLGK